MHVTYVAAPASGRYDAKLRLTPHEALCHPFFAPTFPFRWLVPEASDCAMGSAVKTEGEMHRHGGVGGAADEREGANEGRATAGSAGAKVAGGGRQNGSEGGSAPRKRERAR